MNANFFEFLSLCGVVAIAFGHPLVQGVGLLVVLVACYKMIRLRESQLNWEAIEGAMADYEEIIDGKIWWGKDAEILASTRIDKPKEAGPVCFEHICRTKNGAWFLFQVSVTHGKIVDRSLSPCDEATAKRSLEPHQDAYIRCFGQPTAA